MKTGTVLISGQIERVTDFEKGFPIHYRRRGNDWEPDFMVWDDQCVMVNVRGEGLVVISACSHSGVINTLLNARRLCGEERIRAFIGGWHVPLHGMRHLVIRLAYSWRTPAWPSLRPAPHSAIGPGCRRVSQRGDRQDPHRRPRHL